MQYVDLTMILDRFTQVYPGDRKPEFRQVASTEKEGWNLHEIDITTHTGTHLDAPWHMLKDGKKLSDYPLTRFIGRAILLDVRGQPEIDADLKGVQENDILILRTGHSRHCREEAYYNGGPVVSRQLAEKIVRQKLTMVGIDSYTLDAFPFDIHKFLLKQDVLILENLVNLEALDSVVFKIMVLPLKLDNMDGAPCRVIAETL
jgi:kynurenine formamidase